MSLGRRLVADLIIVGYRLRSILEQLSHRLIEVIFFVRNLIKLDLCNHWHRYSSFSDALFPLSSCYQLKPAHSSTLLNQNRSEAVTRADLYIDRTMTQFCQQVVKQFYNLENTT